MSDDEAPSVLEGIKRSESIAEFIYDKTRVKNVTQKEIAYHVFLNQLHYKKLIRTAPPSLWASMLKRLRSFSDRRFGLTYAFRQPRKSGTLHYYIPTGQKKRKIDELSKARATLRNMHVKPPLENLH